MELNGYNAEFTYGSTRSVHINITQPLIKIMPSVKVKENEPFDIAIRRFKRACEKAGVLSEVRRREFYEKPTAERKRKGAAAVKRHLKKLARERYALKNLRRGRPQL